MKSNFFVSVIIDCEVSFQWAASHLSLNNQYNAKTMWICLLRMSVFNIKIKQWINWGTQKNLSSWLMIGKNHITHIEQIFLYQIWDKMIHTLVWPVYSAVNPAHLSLEAACQLQQGHLSVCVCVGGA